MVGFEGCKCLVSVLAVFLFNVAEGQNIDLSSTPCPEHFQLHYQNRQLIGVITVKYPVQRINTLEVEFMIVCDIVLDPSDNGTLRQYKNDNQVAQDIVAGKDVHYILQFPHFTKQPRIKRIVTNGHLVCIGEGYGIYPLQTTRNLIHKQAFRLNGSLSGLPSFQEQTRPPQFIPTTIITTTTTTSRPVQPAIVDYDDELQAYLNNHQATNFGLGTSPPSTTTRPSVVPNFSTKRPTATKRPPPRVPSAPQEGENFVSEPTCGVSNEINQLAIGGERVTKGKYPWMAAMFVKQSNFNFNFAGHFKCVGNLVTNLHIITAAHCTEDTKYVSLSPQNMLFSIGIHDLSRFPSDFGSQNRNVKRAIVHVDYKDENSDADIAVIILQDKVEFSNYVRPICLWYNYEGDSAIEVWLEGSGTVAGWNEEDANRNEIIPKELKLPRVSNKECLKSAPNLNGAVTDRTFCAGARNKRGPCNGESGTGFLVRIKGKWYLRGLVASSLRDPNTGKCDLTNYIVFTDVLKFTPWILKMLEQT